MENIHRRPSGKRPKKKRFRGNQFMKVCPHTHVAERRDTKKFDLKINKNVCVSLAERDNRRIFTSRKRSLASSFEARRAKKIKKTKEIELFKQQESISYDPGAF
ncbi:hypothetical protein TNIN_30151 [Trichonephila inaurata madagascariensis]|uniref:Uncharacterized protein n=1 Tax=Trichonephila inaurata madagascariensis TaxID=2747483 RepID=A0A8X7CLD6_9ARAC|nr:hypothetical protein TNIN_435831 [Trichonephila inaurata madagascariensis]GFY56629.1 hypothetical protein TNIN_141831 [Trichonephila inaurata madagascariensis]GFY60811.1 hypothetical protein TNIN_170951 [Trichonephila inaurata madagascariensis]GFY72753.1 hypothetical protein TNIN_387791 [Trichonephila inaurata madagascariensis]GFY74511.1 hypothetical protein TNIN_30151 [Trichonephila inaurata madagascariensis]